MEEFYDDERFESPSGFDDERAVLVKYFENVLHDIKTPVSIIMSLAQVMQSSCSGGDRERAFKISDNCRKILKLIQNISDFGRVSSGRILPKYVNMNIVYIAESVSQSIAPLAARKNISIIFDTDTEEREMAVDRDIFERIMLNLLSNAIKFAPEGSEILVRLEDGEGSVEIFVTDGGEGVPDEMLEAIFERYETQRGEANPDGAGVGLAIVRDLVGLLGGRITAESRLDGVSGTTMRVWLPVFLMDARSEGLFQLEI
jgi:signal transduction histidine kinase